MTTHEGCRPWTSGGVEWVAGAVALVLIVGTPVDAATRSVKVTWRPSSTPDVIGYRIYTRLLTGGFVAGINAGLPARAADGTMSFTVGLEATTSYAIGVSGYLASGVESGLSNQGTLLGVGVPSGSSTTTIRPTTTIPPPTTSTTLPETADCPATVIPSRGGTFTGTTTGTSTQNAACVVTGTAPERVFSWTPAVSGVATIDTCNASATSYDTVLYVRSGSCRGSQISCNDDTTGCGTSTDVANPHRGSRVRPTVVAGQTYFIVVDGYNGARGDFSLTVTPPAPVACTATTIPSQGGTFTGATSGGSALTTNCVATGTAPERVFAWTPTVSGTATIQTCNALGTTYDTVLYMRTGSCTGFQMGCNDDTSGCGTTTDPLNPHRGSRLRPTVTAGTTYYLVVDGYNGASGNFSLTVSPPGAPAPATIDETPLGLETKAPGEADATACGTTELCRKAVWDDSAGCLLTAVEDGAVCDASEPCSVGLCQNGTCASPSRASATDVHQLDVQRLLVEPVGSRLRIRARATFLTDLPIDVAAHAVDLELRLPDGTMVDRLVVPADALRPNRTGTTARYVRQRGASIPSADGLQRLKLKVRRGRVQVVVKMSLPRPEGDDGLDRLTWVLHLGDVCARDVALACTRAGERLACESVAVGDGS